MASMKNALKDVWQNFTSTSKHTQKGDAVVKRVNRDGQTNTRLEKMQGVSSVNGSDASTAQRMQEFRSKMQMIKEREAAVAELEAAFVPAETVTLEKPVLDSKAVAAADLIEDAEEVEAVGAVEAAKPIVSAQPVFPLKPIAPAEPKITDSAFTPVPSLTKEEFEELLSQIDTHVAEVEASISAAQQKVEGLFDTVTEKLDGQEASIQKVAEHLANGNEDAIKELTAQISNLLEKNEKVTGLLMDVQSEQLILRTELKDKMHSEHVKMYRNLSDQIKDSETDVQEIVTNVKKNEWIRKAITINLGVTGANVLLLLFLLLRAFGIL